ncbi:GntR family transcriptional regulator [Variovorax sp. HJSM1_2]|uniref:GntR family transcriptional regulator n=1 Tax=Variovorax sp. HJSM1_2 TaxID=3366263 RepID=UPI003BD642B6
MKHLKLQATADAPDAMDITDHLRDGILSGLFAPHSPLRIDALATQFQVSHMPIREALRRLESEGLLDSVPNRGSRVVAVTPAFVADIFDLRSLVEAFMTRRAAERITAQQLAELQVVQTRYEAAAQSQDVAAALAANRAFHSAINNIAGNRDGSLILDRHWRLISALWRVYGYQTDRFEAVISDHRQLLAALAEHDGEAAAALSAAHSMRAKQTLLQRMRQKLDAGDQKASA